MCVWNWKHLVSNDNCVIIRLRVTGHGGLEDLAGLLLLCRVRVRVIISFSFCSYHARD